MRTTKTQGKRPPQPLLPRGSRGVRLLFTGRIWKFRAVVTVDGKRQNGPLRGSYEEAHRDWMRLVGDRQAPRGPVVTLGQGLAAVLAEQALRGRASERSQRATQATCRAILGAWREDIPLSKITGRELDWYVKAAAAKGRAMTSVVEKDLPLLRRALGLGGVPWPADFAPPRKPRRPMAVFTPREVQQLLARLEEQSKSAYGQDRPARHYHRDLVELLWLTGLRAGELARLTIADVDLGRCTLLVRNNKDAGLLGESIDEIELPEQARDLLERLVARTLPDGPKQARRHLESQTPLIQGGEHYLSLMFRRLRERLKEPRLCGRTLRHSFVSAVLQSTGDLALTRDLARHRSLGTTTRYVHALRGNQRQVRAGLSALLAGHSGSPAAPTAPPP